MKIAPRKVLTRILKISGITLFSILALLFLLPYLFPDTITQKIKAWVNQSITSKLEFSGARLSFYNHFPALTLTLKDVSLTGSAPFEADTLIHAREIALGLDITTLFSSSIKIDKIFVSDGDVVVKVNKKGQANYNIYQASGSETDTTAKEQTGLRLKSIVLENINIHYDDQSIPVTIIAENFHYKGSGDLEKSIFDLSTRLSASSFSFIYNGESYINQKPLRAKLTTRVNTSSLSLVFENNRLRINRLPIQFSGYFNFLKNGYDMDFQLQSPKATLEELVSAIPPDMDDWLDNTKVKGEVSLRLSLKGAYIVETNSMPSLEISSGIRNGYIAHTNAPVPVSNLFLAINARLPSLDTDSLDIQLDSAYFALGDGYLRASSHTIGLTQPYIKSHAQVNLDLEQWDRALGIAAFELKGKLNADVSTNGKFERTQHPRKWKKDLIVTSIPAFDLRAQMKDGYFKYTDLPHAVTDISFTLNSRCPDSLYRHTTVSIEDLNARALNSLIRGHIKITSPDEPDIDASFSTNINLGELPSVIPMDSIDIAGMLSLVAEINGKYNAEKNIFPKTNVAFRLEDGRLKTPYYPNAIQKINLVSEIINTTGNISETSISLKPLLFEFEGHPFTANASFVNPEDLQYDINADGTIDLGKIYRVFAINHYDLDGEIEARLSLKGRLSDASAGRYHRLQNQGTLLIKDIALQTESFPKPFFVNTGRFSFRQDKMMFDAFEARYGATNLSVNGYLDNVINYLAGSSGTLHGDFSLNASKVDLKAFTAFSDEPVQEEADSTAIVETGVIMVPGNLSVKINVAADSITYDSLLLTRFKGQLVIDTGAVSIVKTGFSLAGAPFVFDAHYKGYTPRNGQFSFKAKASSFSIARAYDEIPLFREMASSAKGIEGIVGLDYQLNGRLNEYMEVVLPSLKGGGVLSLKKVKLKGFKLMNTVSKSTEYDELRDADVSGIEIRSNVNNNVLNIERVRLRIAGLRPRFEGQVSLDGELNLKGRLGLPPLGIFGIPFTVSGTSDNPEVKLKRDKSGKALQEKEDNEEEEETNNSEESNEGGN
ncbi:MAG: AsmA family protein [Chitinophagaceae bacterium]|nr:AsmA family protein [Chitinophagaceae bacterium]MCW5929210.1 AsmA family protein [Chitinophagaceae bacterium]